MDDEKEALITALESIFNMLKNLHYECEASEYKIDDFAMGYIFCARDLAEVTLKKYKNNVE